MNGLIRWFAINGVAANLLAWSILLAGTITLLTLKKEVLPDVRTKTISIEVVYPRASPEDVERLVCIRIEEAIQGLEGVKQISSSSAEGLGIVHISLLDNEDAQKALNEIKARVDALDTLPELTEKPLIREIVIRRQVVNVSLVGDADERTMKELGDRVRNEISRLPGISQAELVGTRPYEISIELSSAALRKYDLSFDEVAEAVRRRSLNMPSGSIKTGGNEILLRTVGQAYEGIDFEHLVLRTEPDGTRLLLADVADVVDGFEDLDQDSRFDGQPHVKIAVSRVGDQDTVGISATVERYVEELQPRLPEGLKAVVWQDDSVVLWDRLKLVAENGCYGLLLLLVVLAVFLRIRLALWVAFGMTVSVLGTFWILPWLDVSINQISLFGFLLVLGVVVDDAIVVGENVFRLQSEGIDRQEAAIQAAQEVSKPVIFAILTTIVAFIPMMMLSGSIGKLIAAIPMVVIPTLLFSLVDSLFILPNHLSYGKHRNVQERNSRNGLMSHVYRGGAWLMEALENRWYRPMLDVALNQRYLVIIGAVCLLLITLGLIKNSWIKFYFAEPIPDNNLVAMVAMPLGTPVEKTREIVRKIEQNAQVLLREIEEQYGDVKVFRHVIASYGQQPFNQNQQLNSLNAVDLSSPHLGEVHIELEPREKRLGVSSRELAGRWEELTGDLPGVANLTFTGALLVAGKPIYLEFSGMNYEQLIGAAGEFEEHLKTIPDFYNVSNSSSDRRLGINTKLRPGAETLGVTELEIGRQSWQAFYGEEVQKIQRGRDEVRVMVRYPEAERRSLRDLENLKIRVPSGSEIPLHEVSDMQIEKSYSVIDRVDRLRAINVTADLRELDANPNDLIKVLNLGIVSELKEKYPEVVFQWRGAFQDQNEMMESLSMTFPLILVMIYALLAIPFGSYLQPLIIMSVIPFGLIGAVFGHVVMGVSLSFTSLMGIVALSGIVINDNLLIVSFINRVRQEGVTMFDAARRAGLRRFRPIFLTSLTTFVAVMPIVFETRVQAVLLIPMAVSLAFGVLFATIISLILVPAGYLIFEDIITLFKSFRKDKGEVRTDN